MDCEDDVNSGDGERTGGVAEEVVIIEASLLLLADDDDDAGKASPAATQAAASAGKLLRDRCRAMYVRNRLLSLLLL